MRLNQTRTRMRFFGLIPIVLCASAWAGAPGAIGSLTLMPGHDVYPLNPVAQYYKDRGGHATFDEIAKPEADALFHASPDVFQFGYTSSPYWMRFRITNGANAKANWIVALDSNDLLSVDFYAIGSDGRAAHLRSGSIVPVGDRPIHERGFAFPVQLGPKGYKDIYLRVSTKFPMILGVSAYSLDGFSGKQHGSDFFMTLYFGGTMALIVYNLFLFLAFRERSYLYYGLWAGSFAFMAFIVGGFADCYWTSIMSGWTRLAQLSRLLSIIFACQFAREFLNLKKDLPRIDRLISPMIIGMLGLAWLPFTRYVAATGIIYDAWNLGVIGLLTWSSVSLLKKGHKSARYYLLALGSLFLMTVVWVAMLHGFFPGVWFKTAYLVSGDSLELILFSLALADRIHTLRMELLSRMKATNDELERRVRERTRDLEEEIIKRAEAQRLITEQRANLMSASKLSALGEMAAGMAHEINTPLATIQLYAGQIADLADGPNLDPSLFKKAAKNIEMTIRRIAAIIRGLRSFAREGDRDPFVMADIGSLISDTLTLCGERMRAKQVNLELNDFPSLQIECRATQISQVLLNFLNNAYDAIENLPEKWIRLEVKDEGERVTIAISDSGTGIPREIAEKLFQPFFTTKPVGRGIGLGLSISKGIIEQHRGTVAIDNSRANTCFVISLPKKQESGLSPSDPKKVPITEAG